MPVLLFKLNNVPEDEAEEIRDLLDTNNISYYETSAGNWRISLAAIWLNDKTQYEKARGLIDKYQLDRASKARQSLNEFNVEGHDGSFLVRLKEEPLRYLLYLLVILVVLYFSTIPFYNFTEWLGSSVQ